VARAAFALPADLRVALSGTPVENRLDELWSLMRFANPGLLGGRADFDARMSRVVALGDKAAAERLRTRIRPFVLRRLKRDVAPELPSRTEAVLRVELDERERAVYDTVRAASRADVLAMMEAGGGVMKALEALLRLRQAASHSALVPGQAAAGSSKVDVLLESLATAAADGHKALVFSQWTSFLDLVEPHLASAGNLLLSPRWHDPDRAGCHGVLPVRRRPARHAGLPQGGRQRPQPHGRRPRLPVRPVVEPRGRGPGRRPGAQDRTGPDR